MGRVGRDDHHNGPGTLRLQDVVGSDHSGRLVPRPPLGAQDGAGNTDDWWLAHGRHRTSRAQQCTTDPFVTQSLVAPWGTNTTPAFGKT